MTYGFVSRGDHFFFSQDNTYHRVAIQVSQRFILWLIYIRETKRKIMERFSGQMEFQWKMVKHIIFDEEFKFIINLQQHKCFQHTSRIIKVTDIYIYIYLNFLEQNHNWRYYKKLNIIYLKRLHWESTIHINIYYVLFNIEK